MGMMLSLRDWDWLGDPLWGQETIGIGQVLVLPLAAGGAAVMGWRDRGSYFSFLPGGRSQVIHLSRAVGAWLLALSVPYLVAHAFCVLASRWVETHVEDATVFPLITQMLGLLVALAMGYAIGFALNSWAGSVVAAVLLAATIVLDRLGTVTTGLAEYAANGPMLGARPDAGYFASRIAWMLVLATATLVTVTLKRPARQVAVGLIVVTLCFGTVRFRTNDSYVYAESATAYCAGTSVQVCGPPSLARRVREAAALASRVAAELDALGVAHESKLVSWEPAAEGKDWVMLFNAGHLRDPLDPGQVVSSVASPTKCRLWSAEQAPPDEWFAADRLVRSYLAHAVGGKGGLDYQQLSDRMGVTKATGVVREAAEALQACDAGLVPAVLRG
jgi:hypothetical protein